MKASTLIRNAFVRIGKTGAAQSVDGQDTLDAISRLNNLMYAVEYVGMGYTEVDSGSDDITTPAYSWRWMEIALGLELAPEYGQLESYVALEARLDQAWSPIIGSLQRIGPPQLTGNVPIGSGNRRPGDCQYYTETDDGILTETNQEIIVEDATE